MRIAVVRPLTGALSLAAAGLAAVFLVGSQTGAGADSPPKDEVDILVKGGEVIDGSGGPWMRADVAIRGDTIVYVGRAPVKAKRVIDATGRTVTPGFFDMHSHSEFGLSLDGRGLSKVTQGVTTEIMGEHLSAGPVLGHAVDDPMMIAPPVKRSWTTLGGFFSFLEKKGIGPNAASYVGAGQVRASVAGYDNHPITPAQLDQEKRLVDQAMREGALGLSAGFAYVPNSFMSTEELITLAKVAAGYGGTYAVHMASGEAGLQQTIRIARETPIPAEIFHLNSTTNPTTAPQFIDIINGARAEGVDVTANAYPYTMGWTYISQLLPTWAREGNGAAIVARLKDPASRARVVAEMQERSRDNPGRLANTTISSANPQFDAKTLQQIADSRHTTPEEAMIDILIQQNAEGFQIAPPNPARESGVHAVLTQPWVDIGSDGIALPAGVPTAFGNPHPRSFGTHVRFIAQYVRDEHVLSLAEAIRKMTSQAANRLGISDRGLLRKGMKADVVVLDPAIVKDMATVQKPEQYAKGIDWVLINGVPVVADGKPTNALPGRILRGPGYVPGTR